MPLGALFYSVNGQAGFDGGGGGDLCGGKVFGGDPVVVLVPPPLLPTNPHWFFGLG